jgi:uncharacterized protein YndB with AHSA1/START domain
MGPGSCKLLFATVVPAVGAEYSMRMATPMGELDIRGRYEVVEPETRLAFTWSWNDNAQFDPDESRVIVEFHEADGGTDLHLTHENLKSLLHRDNHTEGCLGSIDKLVALFEPSDEKASGQQTGEDCSGATMTVGNFSWNDLMSRDVTGAKAFYCALFG